MGLRGSIWPARGRTSLAALLIALAIGSCGRAEPPTGPPPPPRFDLCRVSFIIDGDSLTCVDGREMRLLLIDAPELGQRPYGAQARQVLVELAPSGTGLEVEYDLDRRDAFGRDLAYLYLADGRMVNEEMALRGYAVLLVIPPNGRHEERIRAAVAEAEAAGRGLWADWKFACLPADFRAGRCE